jgi:hypothetical protein
MPDLAPPSGDSDFYFVPDPETAVSRISERAKARIPKRFGLDPIREVQALCPMNRGGAGAPRVVRPVYPRRAEHNTGGEGGNRRCGCWLDLKRPRQALQAAREPRSASADGA